MVQQFASVSLFDATTDAGTKARVLFEQPQSGVLYQLFGVGTGMMISNSRKLRFLLGNKVYFHGSESKGYRNFFFENIGIGCLNLSLSDVIRLSI